MVCLCYVTRLFFSALLIMNLHLRLKDSCRIDGSSGPHIGLGPAERACIVLLENPRVDAFFVKGVGAGQDPQLSSLFIIHKAN